MMATRCPEVTLPNGLRVFCVNRVEAKLVYRHVAAYFRHGIDVSRGDTVIDVGANIGLFTLAAYQRCDGDVNVYAFEPIPFIFNALRLNTERFGRNRLKALPFGLSSERKTMSFTYFPRVTAWSSAYGNTSNLSPERERIKRSMLAGITHGQFLSWLGWLPAPLRSMTVDVLLRRMLAFETITCQVRTLSEVIDENDIQSIDLLKVDVEKSEMDVLMGIEARHWQRIRQIVIEVEHVSRSCAAINTLLERHGFRHIALDQDEEQSAGDFGMIYASRSPAATTVPA